MSTTGLSKMSSSSLVLSDTFLYCDTYIDFDEDILPETLAFSECGSGLVPGSIGSISTLKQLSFVNMDRIVLPSTIGRLGSLTLLEIFDSETVTIPTEIGLVSKLSFLTVKDATTVEVPTEIGRLDRLKKMTFENINDVTIPGQINKMYRLNSLVLNHLPDLDLPSSLSTLYNLQHLEVVQSGLEEISRDVFKLTHLTNITMPRNELTDFGQSSTVVPLDTLWHLEYLDLSENKIQAVSRDLMLYTPDLKHLYLFNNEISSLGEFPSGWPDWGRLTSMDLSSNRLQSLPTQIGHLTVLTHLDVGNNEIVRIPSHLGALTNLRVAVMHDNRLTNMPSEIGRLAKLTVLNVEHNEITDIPVEIGTLVRLRELYIAENNFDQIPSSMVQLTRLREVRLGALLCDCDILSWFTLLFDRAPNIRDPFTAAQCSESNEYGQNFPHLLKSDVSAPCSSPKLLEEETVIEPTKTTFAWLQQLKNSEDVAMLDSGEPPLAEADLEETFLNCEPGPGGLTGNPALKYLGFAVVVEGVSSDFYSRKCYSAHSLRDLSYTGPEARFSLEIPDLQSSSDFEVTIRPFRLEFDSGGDVALSYRYGIATNAFRLTTEDFPPTTSTQMMHLDAAGARELTVSWESIPGSGDLVVEYELELLHEGRKIQTQKSLTRVATFRGGEQELETNCIYEVSVRGRTSSPTYGPWSQKFNFTTCPLNMAYDKNMGTECYALIGYFKYEGQAVSCTTIPGEFLEDGGCDVVGIDVETIPLTAGSWRPSLASLEIQSCPEENFCAHAFNLSGANQYCAEKHQGIFCSECEEGYALATVGCVPCDTKNLVEGETAIYIGILMFALIVSILFTRIMAIAGLCKRPKKERKMSEVTADPHDFSETGSEFVEVNPLDAATEVLNEIERQQKPKKELEFEKVGCREAMYEYYILFSKMVISSAKHALGTKQYSDDPGETTIAVKLQIFFAFNQVIFAYGRILTSTTVPTSLAAVIGFVTYVDFGAFFAEFKFRCIYDFTHYDDLVLRACSPIVLLSCLYLLKKIAACIYPDHSLALHRAFVSMFLFILFLIYPSVSQVILETFWCESFDAVMTNSTLPVIALKSDYRLSCHHRESWVLFALIMVAVYPIGIVLVYAYYLYIFRHLLKKAEKTIQDRQTLVTVSFLVEPYRKEAFWFEAYELIRKLFQTSLIGFFQETPKTMTFFASCLCVAAIGVVVYFQPYKRGIDNVFAFVSLMVLAGGIQYSNDVRFLNGGTFIEPMTSIVYVELAAFCAFAAIDILFYIRKQSYI